MNEQGLEIYRQLRLSQDKYTYFLLAASGAAVALAINQTREASLSVSQVPLALAVLAWAASFYSGCRHLNWTAAILGKNFELLRVEEGTHPMAGNEPEHMQLASGVLRTILENDLNTASRLAQWQFASFILGAAFYISWHIGEMWMRT